MGNKSLSTHPAESPFGKVTIELDHLEYRAGSQMKGEVNLEIEQRFYPDSFDIQIIGKIKTRTLKGVIENDFNNSTQQIALVNQSLHTFHDGIEPGYYKFPIAFDLPEALPGSFLAFNAKKFKAKIFYKVIVTLRHIGMHEKVVAPLVGKKKFLIVQQFMDKQAARQLEVQKIYRNLLGQLQEVNIKVTLEKEWFQPEEIARVHVDANLLLCGQSVGSFKLRLWRVLVMRLESGSSAFQRFDDVLCEADYQGAPKQQRSEFTLPFPLANAYGTGNYLQEYKIDRKVSPEVALFYGLKLPSVDTQLVQCFYYISIQSNKIKPQFIRIHMMPRSMEKFKGKKAEAEKENVKDFQEQTLHTHYKQEEGQHMNEEDKQDFQSHRQGLLPEHTTEQLIGDSTRKEHESPKVKKVEAEVKLRLSEIGEQPEERQISMNDPFDHQEGQDQIQDMDDAEEL